MAATSEGGESAEARAAALEEQVSRLAQMAKTLAAAEARGSALEVAAAAEAAMNDLDSARVAHGDADPAGRDETLKARLGDVTAQATKVYSAATERFARELEPLRVEVAQAVLSRIAERKGGGGDLFRLADRDGDGAVDRGEFLDFVARNSREGFAPERLHLLFDYLDDDADGRLSRDEFARCLIVLYRVSRPNVDLCHTMGLTQGRLVRRLELNETAELVEGPVRESNGAVRIRCRSLRDGATGWAMACGSNGVVFMQQTRIHFQVKRSTPLTSTFSVDGSTALRQLKEGELLEVLVWERLHEQSGLKRLRGRALRDSAVGWATTVGNGGMVYLQAV
uniref:EF-hand domain-containing protein n=1 Tax=Alexandrium monilatum TaxID=311494 RepID=A0A7S4PWT6_9DINO